MSDPIDSSDVDAPAFVLVTTTVDSEEAAEAITTMILEQRLAACVQAEAIQSAFWWKGRLEHTREIRLQAKAPEANVPALMAAIEGNHPYEVPEIIVTAILDGHPAYLRWIGDEARPELADEEPPEADLEDAGP